MKKLILIIALLTISLYPHSKLLLLFGDDNVYTGITITANTSNYVIDNGGGSYYFQVAGTVGKKFKVDWGDGTQSEITLTVSDQRIAKTYANAGTYKLRITGWESVTRLSLRGWNAGAMSLQSLPSGLTYLLLWDLGANITGSLDNLPSGLTSLNLWAIGANITGSLDNLPSGLTYLDLQYLGSNITGSISNLPSGLTVLRIGGLGTNITGTLSNLSSLLTMITLVDIGNNIDITSGTMKAWANTLISIKPQSGYGYTTAQIDGFLNAWAPVAGTGTQTIDLRGANQPRSSASDAAVATLVSKGKTILTNP